VLRRAQGPVVVKRRMVLIGVGSLTPDPPDRSAPTCATSEPRASARAEAPAPSRPRIAHGDSAPPAHARSAAGREWLLLDPPSEDVYVRRGLLREKSGTAAAFPNIDLILLSGSVREAGFRPVYVDAQIRRWGWRRLCDELRGRDIAGVVSIVSCDGAERDLRRLRHVKDALGGVPVYVVVPIATVLQRQACGDILANHPHIDGLILNSVEHNLTEILRGDAERLVNVAARRDGRVAVPDVTVRYETGVHLPMPEHAIFRDHRYFFPQSKRNPVTCVQLSFGCPYTCEFCIDNALYRKMRYRDVDSVVEELVEIDRLGFREVYFKDLTFGLNKRIADEFLGKLAERRLNLRWLCTTRIDVATPRLLRYMKRAGCYGIEFGVESGLRHRREANGKPISDEQIKRVFYNCRSLGIETTALVMIGFEDETEEEIRTTMAFVSDLDPDYVAYNVVNALAGTPLAERAKRGGFLLDELNEQRFTSSNIRHRYLTPQRLDELRVEAVRSFYRRPRTVMTRLAKAQGLFELWKLVRLAKAAAWVK